MEFIKDSEHLSIPFQDIYKATNNFTTLIGKGGYGKVYKGELSLSGKLTSVAVKRLDKNLYNQGFKEFLTEIQLLSRYKHANLVSLVGFCHEGHEKILVYEYAERGSLDKYRHVDEKTCSLRWKQRMNICIDAARGLNYLHNHVAKTERVIHRDVKSANILLDYNWKAMIADLGLSKLGRANENDTYLITNACGTHGYCDPAYIHTGVLTKESDVYSFGVVLFEVLCGRLALINVNNEQRFLAPLAQRFYEAGKLNEIIDPCLKDQMDSDSLNLVSKIAYQCLNNDREKRPSMDFVLEILVEALEMEVQRSVDDVGVVITTYEGEHNHRSTKQEATHALANECNTSTSERSFNSPTTVPSFDEVNLVVERVSSFLRKLDPNFTSEHHAAIYSKILELNLFKVF